MFAFPFVFSHSKWSLVLLLSSYCTSTHYFCSVSGSLTDAHILDLSQRITSESELMELGIKVLGLPDFLIKTALYDNREKMQPATHEILSRWLKAQNSRQEAYVNLQAGLRKCGMKELAVKLTQWVEGTAVETTRTIEKGK